MRVVVGVVLGVGLLFTAQVCVRSEMCVGCFRPVTDDWRRDPVLAAVADKAIRDLKAHFNLVDVETTNSVVDFQSQVVAGTNFLLTIEVVNPSLQQTLRCSQVRVFRPLPSACKEPDRLCLTTHFDDMACVL